MIVRIVVIYLFCICAVVGSITSASFAAAMVTGAMGYVIGRWRAVDSPSRIEVIGRDVRVPRAVVRRVWWWM